MDVANIKKVIKVGALLGNVGGKVFEDGKITASDIAVLPDFMAIFGLLIDVKWAGILPEAKDFSIAEANELIEEFCNAFNIPQKKIEMTIEAVLATVNQIIQMIFNLIHIFKTPAAA